MKKYTILFWTLVLLVVAATSVISCDNGIGDNLDALTARLAEVNAELAAATSGMQTSIVDISAELQSALETVQANQAQVQEAIATIEDLQSRLDGIISSLQDAATDEDLADLLAQVENLQETIQELEDYGDTDYDGIINYLDKCPGTDPGVEVDTDGCPIND